MASCFRPQSLVVWDPRVDPQDAGLTVSKSECEHAERRLAGKTRSRPTFRAFALMSSNTMARARSAAVVLGGG
jgi:hypothetical protein